MNGFVHRNKFETHLWAKQAIFPERTKGAITLFDHKPV